MRRQYSGRMADVRTPRLLVFDLDGTLIDSRQDLASSVNGMLQRHGRKELSQSEIASFIGNGASVLVERALMASPAEGGGPVTVETALRSFLELYRERKLEHTYVYAGVLPALSAMQARWPGVLMACLTNKPVRPAREICRALGLAPFFFQSYGGDSFPTKKPDPSGLLRLCSEAAVLLGWTQSSERFRAETVMIGDSAVDAETARLAGTLFAGCAFGFDPQSLAGLTSSALANAPSEWQACISSLFAAS